MTKIMLVIDNPSDLDFLEKVLKRLSFIVISMKKGDNLSEQLIDHFPDIVFASTLGKNEKTLEALARIKEARGKPKLVFVRQENESQPLNNLQKKVIDGVLYCPVDPFKLIDLLSHLTGLEIQELRQSYNSMLNQEKKSGHNSIWVEDTSNKAKDFGATTVFGNKTKPGVTVVSQAKERSEFESTHELNEKTTVETNQPTNVKTSHSSEPSTPWDHEKGSSSSMITDPGRKNKYDQICRKLDENPEKPKAINGQQLRELQSRQASEIQESQSIKDDRKAFIKTLFSMSARDVKKKV